MDRGDLVGLMAAGDERAWRFFVRDYGRLIYAVGARFGLDADERDDHFQACCVSVYRALPSLREPGRLGAWLYNIACRQAIDLRRRRRPGVVEVEEDGEGAPALEPAVLETLLRLEDYARLRDALAGLDPRCRRLLTALFLDDPPQSYAELSRREGLPLGSIGPTRARCLGKLEKRYAELSEAASAASTTAAGRRSGTPSGRKRSKS